MPGNLRTALRPSAVQRVVRGAAGAAVAAGARSEGPRGALTAARVPDGRLERAGRAFAVACRAYGLHAGLRVCSGSISISGVGSGGREPLRNTQTHPHSAARLKVIACMQQLASVLSAACGSDLCTGHAAREQEVRCYAVCGIRQA